MQSALWVIVTMLVIATIVYGLVTSVQDRRRTSGRAITGPAGATPDEIESVEAYRNHLAMARWIELQLKDDLVRTSVPEEEQTRARRLLDEFYGDER